MSVAFNGSSSFISASVIPGNVGGNSQTISLWVNTRTAALRQFLFSEGQDVANSRFAIEIRNSPNVFGFSYFSSAILGSTTIVINKWYHVAVTYASNLAILYVNGIQEASVNDTMATSGTNFNIGRFYGGSLYTDGFIGEVSKWNTSLSADEILSLSKGFSPMLINPQSIAFYAPLVRNVIDLKGLALTSTAISISKHPRIYN